MAGGLLGTVSASHLPAGVLALQVSAAQAFTFLQHTFPHWAVCPALILALDQEYSNSPHATQFLTVTPSA